MKNSAWDQLSKQDRSNLFFVLRGDQPQQELIATKRNSMDNGATVLDILGATTLLASGAALSGQSLSEVFLNMKEKILAEARHHPPVEFPERDERLHRRSG